MTAAREWGQTRHPRLAPGWGWSGGSVDPESQPTKGKQAEKNREDGPGGGQGGQRRRRRDSGCGRQTLLKDHFARGGQ